MTTTPGASAFSLSAANKAPTTALRSSHRRRSLSIIGTSIGTGTSTTTKTTGTTTTRTLVVVDDPILVAAATSWADLRGLAVWRACLLRGRMPERNEDDDFDFNGADDDYIDDDNSDDTATPPPAHSYWPAPARLFDRVAATLLELQLPRLVMRHPELCTSVLLCVIKVQQEYERMMMMEKTEGESLQQQEKEEKEKHPSNDAVVSDYDDEFAGNEADWDDEPWPQPVPVTMDKEEEEVDDDQAKLLDELVGDLLGALSPAATAAPLLDQIAPLSTDLVSSIGLHDGLWQHDGWQLVPELLQMLQQNAELRRLLARLGQRATADDSSTQKSSAERRKDLIGPTGPVAGLAPSSIAGLKLSGHLHEMLPSEAVLLKGGSNNSSGTVLRTLFLSKLADDKLWSYRRMAWEDAETTTQKLQPRRLRHNMKPGGPMIVCLDTSDSMTSRQRLSKTICLAAAMAALRDGRECRIVAFASTGNVICADPIITTPQKKKNNNNGAAAAAAASLRRLLDFLSHSFTGGGTDVTGALRYAVHQLMHENDNNEDDGGLESADILLVTDGEIPIVTDETLLREIANRELQLHGLSVGRQPSRALDQLCTETHDFLMEQHQHQQYAMMINGGSGGSGSGWGGANLRSPSSSSSSSSSQRQQQPRTTTALLARRRRFDDWEDELLEINGDTPELQAPSSLSSSTRSTRITPIVNTADYSKRVEQGLDHVRRVADETVREAVTLQPPSLLKPETRKVLEDAISSVSANLLERDQEANLVVLAYISGEHGTAKSQLGRRLSTLCGRPFFQRLLTRFTTPEELFGPLSLQALERDIYQRKTDGYLPTASIAFLDEVFKANSAILNTLLTILNERKFDNGGIREDCPVKCVIAASNELPDNEELDALYDRFLLRKEVVALSDEGLLSALLMKSPGNMPSTPPRDDGTAPGNSLDEALEEIMVLFDSVELSTHVALLIKDLRLYLRGTLDVDLSDRRLIQSARLLRICAATNGRRRVEPIDCMLLQHIAWQTPQQHNAIKEWLWNHITPGRDLFQLATILDTMRQEAISAVRKTSGDCSGRSGATRLDVDRIAGIREETRRIINILQSQKRDLEVHRWLAVDAASHLWLEPNEARSFQQSQEQYADQSLATVRSLLVKAIMLELALSPTTSTIADDTRLDVIVNLWSGKSDVAFSEDELAMDMKEAKATFDDELFRHWKRQRKGRKLGST